MRGLEDEGYCKVRGWRVRGLEDEGLEDEGIGG